MRSSPPRRPQRPRSNGAGPRTSAAPHSSFGGLERTLIALHPALPRHARLYFSDVPQDVGIGHDWFQSAFEIWYRDTTIRAGFLSSYRPRAAAEPAGPDLFFRFVPPARWVEIVAGPEDVARASAADPGWADHHRRLALTFGGAGDWTRAAGEVAKLASTFPGDPQYALNLAYCLERAGDDAGARRWMARADSLRAPASEAAPP